MYLCTGNYPRLEDEKSLSYYEVQPGETIRHCGPKIYSTEDQGTGAPSPTITIPTVGVNTAITSSTPMTTSTIKTPQEKSSPAPRKEVQYDDMDVPKRKILVIHGAGMNMRGKVNIEKFGKLTLADYEREIKVYAAECLPMSIEIEFFRSNTEGEIIDRLYAAFDDDNVVGVVANPAGFTKGYRALVQAVEQVNTKIPVIEVHISNPAVYGTISDVSPASKGVITGLGLFGYSLALRYLAFHLNV